MQVREAIILAGGAGTRLRERVPNAPKPMAPVGNRPFLELLLDYWIDQGITKFILSLGHLPEKFATHFGNSYRGVPLAYAVEERPLDTGGALLLASAQLETSGPFLVLNGDTLFLVRLASLESAPDRVTIALTEQSDPRFSEVLLDGSRVRALTKRSSNTPALVNGGVYLFGSRDLLTMSGRRSGDRFPLESELLPFLAESGRLFGCRQEGRFVDIGTPKDYDLFQAGPEA